MQGVSLMLKRKPRAVMAGLYRCSDLGTALQESCDDMVDAHCFGDDMHSKIMQQFDKVTLASLGLRKG